MAKGPKTNGFSHGLNIHQIVSYVLLSTKIFLFQYFLVSNFIDAVKIPLSVFYYIATITMITCGLLATLSDPTDDVVKMERKAKLAGQPFETSRYEFQCEFCATSVSHSDTKHCRSCGRCVDGFDHHCDWVNNCISKKNYRAFAVLIGSLEVSALTFVVAGTLFAGDYFTGQLHVIEELEIVRNDLKEWQAYVVVAFTFINAALVFLDMKLIMFHLYLYRKNLTTYQYIIEGREKQKEKISGKRSSITINKGKSAQKTTAQQDIEDAKDVSLHDHQDKQSGEKIRLVGSIPMSNLNYRSQEFNEEAYSPHEGKLNFNHSRSNSHSSTAQLMMSLDKSAKVSDRSNYHDSPKKHLIIRDHAFGIDFKAEMAGSSEAFGEIGHSNNRFPTPISSQATPTHAPTTFPNYSSPTNGGLLAGGSYQEIQTHERKDSREFDETEPPTSAKGEGVESRLVAFSIARIADNYIPQYGKISEEEEGESELPNLSDGIQDYESKGI